MNTQDVDDETLMAYADNMLDPADRTRIEKLVASNPAVAAKVRMFQQTSSLTHAALAPLLDVPVPEPLLAAVRSRISDHKATPARNLSLATLLQNRLPRWSLGLSMAAAASIAGVIGVTFGYQQAIQGADQTHLAVGTAPSAPIVSALNTLSSGEETAIGTAKLRVVSTFRISGSSLCREFEYIGQPDGSVVSVACEQGRNWNIRFATVFTPMESGYAPASSLEAVDAYMSAIGAGPALTPADEAAALKSR
jgi:anti-sigma factor RsiW